MAYTNQLASSVKNLTAQQQALILSSNGLNQARVYEILKTNELTDAEIAQAMATLSLSTSTKELTVADVEGMLAAQLGNTERAKAIMTQLGLVGAQETGIVSTANLTREEVILTLTQQGLTTAQAEGIATQLGLTASSGALSTAFKGLALYAKNVALSLKAMAMAHPLITALTVVITGAVVAYKHYAKQREEAAKKAQAEKENLKTEIKQLKEQSQELDAIIDRYKELSKQSSLSAEEKQELVELQNQLIDSFGDEAKGIDLVNGQYDKQIKKLKELNKEQSESLYATTNALRLQNQLDYNNNKSNVITTSEMETVQVDSITEKIWDAWSKISGVTFDMNGATISGDLNAQEKVDVLNQMIYDLRANTSSAEKETEYYVLLLGRLTSLLNDYQAEVDNYNSTLAEEAELAVGIFESKDGVNFDNVTAETYDTWVTALINEYAKDDPELQNAIYEYLRKSFDDSYRLASMSASDLAYYWANKAKEDAKKVFKSEFDISEWAETNGISDLEGRMEKLKTAYGKLEDGKSGFELGQSFYKDFPELAVYANDTKRLREEMEKIAKLETSQLIAQLSSQITKTTDPANKSALQTAVKLLQDMANLSAETEYNYDKQAKQIKKNIHALNDAIGKTEKLKKEAEKRKEILEKEKDVLEKQKKSLEKQKEAVEKSYQARIDTLDDEIDRMQEEADEQERINDLKEKELALEKAKHTQVRRFSAARGWIVETDSQAVKEAQKEYDDAVREKQIDDLEQQKKQLEKEKEAATESFDAQIDNIETQIEAYENRIEEVEKVIDSYDAEIEKYKSLKDEQNSYLSFYKTYSADFATATGEQAEALGKLNQALEKYRDLSDLPEIQEAYKKAMEQYSDAYDGYSQGGVVNYNGLARLHGANGAELVLNNNDVGKIYQMIHGSTAAQLVNTMAQNSIKKATSATGNLNSPGQYGNNSYTWQLSGNNIIVDSYEKFKGYMDRYVREAKQDLVVGR